MNDSLLEKATPRPQKDVLAEYADYYQSVLALNPGIRDVVERMDAPEKQFRWLVRLDCGCVTEALTRGEEAPVAYALSRRLDNDRSVRLPWQTTYLMSKGVSCGSHCEKKWCYPAGYLWCANHEEHLPYREITTWVARTGGSEKYDHWAVQLSCGHCATVVTPQGWQPEYGHKYQPEKAEQLKQKLALVKKRLKGSPGYRATMDLFESDIRTGCPEPATEHDCAHCAYLRQITGCRPVGYLPRPRKPRQRRQPSAAERRHTLQQRLKSLEAEARRVQDQLRNLS